MDQVLIATSHDDLIDHRRWAEVDGLGLELQAFSDPLMLTTTWREVLSEHKKALSGFSGIIGLHGAFYDMVSASLDPAIIEVTRTRYRQNLHAASELNARYVVFHLNYMGILRLPNYRPGWHSRQLEFWGRFADEAGSLGVYVLLENLWEDDPTLVTDILDELRHPYLKTCLDVAHVGLFSLTPVTTWIRVLEPYLYCCHLNNHDGEHDVHWPLGQGVIDYPPILERLRGLPEPPLLSLEMPTRERIEASLPYLILADRDQ